MERKLVIPRGPSYGGGELSKPCPVSGAAVCKKNSYLDGDDGFGAKGASFGIRVTSLGGEDAPGSRQARRIVGVQGKYVLDWLVRLFFGRLGTSTKVPYIRYSARRHTGIVNKCGDRSSFRLSTLR
jgi:hypothetical protein